jgi:hypothetical protein
MGIGLAARRIRFVYKKSMKNFIAVTILILLAATSKAQTFAASFSIATPVKITSWGSRSVHFVSGYWDMARPQLEKKLSKRLVDSIISYSAEYLYPDDLRTSLANNDFKPDKNDLKMYLVASFDNNFNGTFHGVIYVVRVPVSENKTWAYDDDWKSDLFIILPKEAVKLVD